MPPTRPCALPSPEGPRLGLALLCAPLSGLEGVAGEVPSGPHPWEPWEAAREAGGRWGRPGDWIVSEGRQDRVSVKAPALNRAPVPGGRSLAVAGLGRLWGRSEREGRAWLGRRGRRKEGRDPE